MEKYMEKGIKEVIDIFPGIADILEEYDMGIKGEILQEEWL